MDDIPSSKRLCLAVTTAQEDLMQDALPKNVVAKDVTFESIEMDLWDSFERIVLSPLFGQKINVVVTPVMRKLYEAILEDGDTKFYLCGPPGTGKSITLYWLYQILKNSEKFFPVTFPFQTLNEGVNISSPPNKRLVILVDVVSPSLDLLKSLIKLLTRHCKDIVVIAFSSSYEIFSFANTRSMTYINEWKRAAKRVHFKSYDNEASQNFLKSILHRDLKDYDKDMMKLCKGIPRLLAYCYKDINILKIKEQLHDIVEEEFTSVIDYMVGCKEYVKWKNEFYLLMAVKFNCNIEQFNMTVQEAQKTCLCRSYLVGIENDVPFSHFHVTVENEKYFLDIIKSLWTSYRSFAESVSSASVKGVFFEARVPSIIKDKIEITIQKLGCTTKQNISIDICTTVQHLYALGTDLPGYNVLWRAPKNSAGIDYYAKIKELRLPDDPDVNFKDTILAMQVSVQVADHNAKVSKSITKIFWDLCRNKNVIFMVVNPLWDDFKMLFEASNAAVSGPGFNRRPEYKFLWYGHFNNMETFKATEKSLSYIFD